MSLPLKIGCDPEVFVVDPTSNLYRCAHGMVPGTKREPFPVPYGAVQVDGMALEFNIDPASSKDEFVHNVTSVFNHLKGMVPAYKLVPVPVAKFGQEYFDQCPEIAKELGCEPDFDAYKNGAVRERPSTNRPFRTGAGHVHIGWHGPNEYRDPRDPGHIQDCIDVVIQLDHYLGLRSLIWDKDSERRELYGQAGSFRIKPYGCEYRPLSNAWLATPELIGYVYDTTVMAVNDLFEGNNIEMKMRHEGYVNSAKKYINNSDDSWRRVLPRMLTQLPDPPMVGGVKPGKSAYSYRFKGADLPQMDVNPGWARRQPLGRGPLDALRRDPDWDPNNIDLGLRPIPVGGEAAVAVGGPGDGLLPDFPFNVEQVGNPDELVNDAFNPEMNDLLPGEDEDDPEGDAAAEEELIEAGWNDGDDDEEEEEDPILDNNF